MTIHDRAMKGAEKYLQITGRKLLYNYSDVQMLLGYDDVLVYMDEDCVCIGKVHVSTSVLTDEEHDNRIDVKQFEEVLHEVVYSSDDVLDKSIRPDLIEMYVVGGNKAIVKHTINAGCFDW